MLAVLLTLGAVGLLVATNLQSTTPLRAQVLELETQVGSVRAQLASLRSQLHALRGAQAAAHAQLASLRTAQAAAAQAIDIIRLRVAVRALQVCAPELRQELLGLSLKTTAVNGWLTGAQLASPVSLSPACTQVLSQPR